MTICLRYQDDGPLGVGGQIMKTSMPWDKLCIFDSHDEAENFRREIEDNQSIRKNPRITGVWVEERGEVFDGTTKGI